MYSENLMGSGVTRRRALLGIGSSVAATAMGAQRREVSAQEATPSNASGIPADFKVVLHAAEEQDWLYVLSNLRNLTEE